MTVHFREQLKKKRILHGLLAILSEDAAAATWHAIRPTAFSAACGEVAKRGQEISILYHRQHQPAVSSGVLRLDSTASGLLVERDPVYALDSSSSPCRLT